MDDTVLRRNRRGHTAADVERASGLIRASGLSLGLQMMVGLPGDTPAGAWKTARRLAALRPETMRIYPTIVLPGSLLASWYQEGTYRPLELGEAVELCAGLLSTQRSTVRVIRLGLHSSPELERERLAGPWHPAFRELCESFLYLRAFRGSGRKAEESVHGFCESARSFRRGRSKKRQWAHTLNRMACASPSAQRKMCRADGWNGQRMKPYGAAAFLTGRVKEHKTYLMQRRK